MLECTGLASLEQLNSLAKLTSALRSLTVCSHGNPITQLSLFRPYALFRLRHLGLQELNGAVVSEEELAEADRLFGSLAASTRSLPPSRLASLSCSSRWVLRQLHLLDPKLTISSFLGLRAQGQSALHSSLVRA